MTGLLICAALFGVMGVGMLRQARTAYLRSLKGVYLKAAHETAVVGFTILGLALIAAALYLAWRAGGAGA